jgi:hypothetical protein
VSHGPLVRWMCVLLVAASGLICLGFAALLPLTVADDPTAAGWVAGLSEMWPLVGCVGGVGLLQLALAGWGVWTRHSAEGAG